MITKQDCMTLLVRLEDNGVQGINSYLNKLLLSKEVPIEVLRFIAKNRGLEAVNFYEMLRKNYNQKKSHLYYNIVKNNALENPEDVVTTLACLLVQITLYGNKLKENTAFFKEIRAEEISRALNDFFKTGIYETCLKLLKIIKTDIMVLEYINGRRELQQ